MTPCSVVVPEQVINNVSVLAIFEQEKAQLPAIRICEKPMLPTKSTINHPGYKISRYFR